MQLPQSFRKGGFDYTQVKRNDHCVIYRQDLDGANTSYEVCHILRRKESVRVMGGKEIVSTAGEHLPGTEQWGAKAWTLRTIDQAERTYNEQTERLEARAAASSTVPQT